MHTGSSPRTPHVTTDTAISTGQTGQTSLTERTSSLDRRMLLRGAAVPAALALAGLSARRLDVSAQEATPAAGATPAATESGYAPVNGLEIYYEIHGAPGPEGTPPLVMLPGGLSTIDLQFAAVLPALAQGRQVIAAEVQAHGHTADIDRPLRFEDMADDIAGLLDHLGIPQADAFGYSLGGGVLTQLAIRRPELVRKLVLMSTAFARSGWVPEALNGMAAMNAEVAELMKATPLYEAYARVAPRVEDWPVLVTKVSELMSHDYDWSTGVQALPHPTQIVIGDGDSIIIEHAVEFFRLRGGGVPGDFGPLPTSELAILPHTAHSAITFRADLLLPIIPAFLDAPKM